MIFFIISKPVSLNRLIYTKESLVGEKPSSYTTARDRNQVINILNYRTGGVVHNHADHLLLIQAML